MRTWMYLFLTLACILASCSPEGTPPAAGVQATPAQNNAPPTGQPSEPTGLPQMTASPALQGQLQELNGLVFSDLVGGKTWIITNGVPVQLYPQPFARPASDLSQVLLEQGDDLWVASLPAGSPVNLTQTADRLERSAQWWPANPDRIAFFSASSADGFGMSSGQLSLMNRDGGNPLVLDETPSFGSAALSPDGNTIAYDAAGQPRLYRLDGSQENFDYAAYNLPVPLDLKAGSPAYSPDGNQLAWWISGSVDESGNSTTALAVVDLENRTTSMVHPYHSIGMGGWPQPPAWSPDGQWLAFVTLGEGSKGNLWVSRPDGSEEHNLGDAAYPVWSPDGSQLVYTLWDPQGGDFTKATTMKVEAGSWLPETIELTPGAQPLEWRTP